MSDRRFLGDSWMYIAGCERYRFVLSRDLRDEERPRVVSATTAEYVIDVGLDHHWNAHIIEDMHEAIRPGYYIGFAPRKEDILPEVLEAVREGDLVAFKEEQTPPPRWYRKEEPIAKPPPAEEQPPGTFDLQVVLDGDGSGVRQLSLGVKTKGEGEFRALRTNGVGSIFVDLVVRGTADVRSDIKGARMDQSAVVVGWGSSPIEKRSGAEAEDSSQIRFLVEIEEYRVRDGDTARTLAARAKRSWEDLAYFNWGTRMPEEINKHLASKVGCTKKGADGNFVFSGDDWPGIIRFPKPFSRNGLPTDTKNVLRVKHIPLGPEVFIIDLHIDPADPRTRDDSYILLNEDGSEHQRRHVGDDAVPGDDHLTLAFTGLRRGLAYSLLINEGREGEHFAFHNVLLDDLLETTADPDAKIDAPGPHAEPGDYDSLELEEGFPEVPAELREPRRSTGWAIVDRPPSEGINDPIV